MHKQQNNCRVCGYDDDIPHWGEDGKTADFDFCVCCGVQHGHHDCLPEGARSYREKWISSGAQWEEKSLRPTDWKLEEQLKKIPLDFL